jgi:hypothetical protein
MKMRGCGKRMCKINNTCYHMHKHDYEESCNRSGVCGRICRPIKKAVSRKPAPNTRKLFAKAHAAYVKWEHRHNDVTCSEVCFVAGAKWAARQLA